MKINELIEINLQHDMQSDIGSDPNYFYHITNEENLHDIIDSGKLNTHKPWFGTDQESWPDGSIEKRAYFSSSPNNIWQFAPKHGRPVIIRVLKNISSFKKERTTNDVYTQNQIPAKYFEVLTKQGWKSIKNLK